MNVWDAKVESFAACVIGRIRGPSPETIEEAIDSARSLAADRMDSAQMAEGELRARQHVAWLEGKRARD